MKLKDVIIQCSEKVWFNDIPIFWVNNKTWIDTAKDVSDNTSNYKIIKNNYFAYNPYRINIWSIWLFKWDIWWVSPAYVVFRIDESKVGADFLLVFLKSRAGSLEINKHTYWAVRKSLSFKNLWNIEIPDLTIDEQKNLLSKIDEIDKIEKLLNENLKYTNLLKDRIVNDIIN